MDSKTNCIICDEKINKSKHILIACPYCSFEACKTCCEKYIKDQTIAKCMNKSCEKEWTRNFMVSAFTKTFINNDWKKHREEILYQKEIALLPATQIKIEDIKRKDEIKKELFQINQQIAYLKIKKDNLSRGLYKNTLEKKIFVRACPEENCRGFLSSQWKCGLCNKNTCSNCHVIKEENVEHICNENDLATAKLLEKDTKCCPKCSTGIFKIDGCDQMWCVMCHTAFSWKTGNIEINIHNPHFYEWQRLNGTVPRNPGDIPCGRELNHTIVGEIADLLKNKERLFKYDPLPENAQYIYNKILFLIPRLSHLRYYDFTKYRTNHIENNEDLRIKYMLNEIDEEKFKIDIQKKNKFCQKNNEIYQLLDLFITSVTDIIYRLIDTIKLSKPKNIEYEKLNNILNEIDNITEYINECFKTISICYGSKLKKISFDRTDIHNILF